MTQHELKTINPHFQDQFNGRKTFEIRRDDRGFQVGDTLKLLEYEMFTNTYSGRWVTVFVTHILSGYQSVEDGLVVMCTERRSRLGDDGKVEEFSYQTTVETDEAILIIGQNDFWKYKSKSLTS
jgi:hypothetical protein